MITDLPLFQRADAPDIANDALELVLLTLTGADWMTARRLQQFTGIGDRTLRAIANASDGQIISGQQGYKLTKYATPEEIQHAAGWLESQANKMGNRARAIRRRAIRNVTRHA